MSDKKIIKYEKIISHKNISEFKRKFVFKKKIRLYEKKNVVGIYSFLSKYYGKKDLSKFKNLKFVLSPTTGLNHLDLNYLKKKKIKLFSLDVSHKEIRNITSTAELSITMILNSIRNIYKILSDTKNFKFSRYKYKFKQFRNYTVGIIGYGRIGKKVNKYVKILDFKTKIFDPNLQKNRYNFNKIISECDILTLHCPYKGKQILNKKNFIFLKKDIRIVNTSRGELIDEKNLYLFLKNNPESQYWTDVLTNEQSRINMKKKDKNFHKLNKLRNFFITPHIGGASIDAMQTVEKYIFTKLKHAIK